MGGVVQADGRYLYERLHEKTFQQLCNVLLAHNFPDTRCYPVGHSDGAATPRVRWLASSSSIR
jgi:hypothetical protein